MPDAGRRDPDALIIGAGPIGLTLALDLGLKGHDVVVLNRLDFVAAGSRAICFAKRTLDIWDRLGVGQSMVEKGVVWNVGKVFRGPRQKPIYEFELLPIATAKNPAFINLQQYHVEELLIAALARLPNVEIRWGHEAVGIVQESGAATITARCAGTSYEMSAPWVIACDGSRSSIRDMMALDFEGRAFEDNFLIADVRFKEQRPSERWFWFDPPFNPGRSALLHKQPDDVWRLDFQLGSNIDRKVCVRPENVEPLVRGMLGEEIESTPEWYSVYTFQCRRMARFVHGRVLFAGDAAHLVSPFGARGCNNGVADADNIAWKLDLVLGERAPPELLESYNHEAIATADENILHSTRSTDFLTPKSDASRAFRDAVLELASDYPFARQFVNSGRLSSAVSYPESPLNTPDTDDWEGGVAPGSPALDAPLADGWLLGRLGERFVLLSDDLDIDLPQHIDHLSVLGRGDDEGLVAKRYDLRPGSAYLVRPDHYIAARWRNATAAGVAAALARAHGVRA